MKHLIKNLKRKSCCRSLVIVSLLFGLSSQSLLQPDIDNYPVFVDGTKVLIEYGVSSSSYILILPART